jgi:DNA-binding Lrp family transcriptional regulator
VEPVRLEIKILRVLRDGGASVLEIAEETMVNPKRIQYVLDRLEDSGMLKGVWRNGRKVYLRALY